MIFRGLRSHRRSLLFGGGERPPLECVHEVPDLFVEVRQRLEPDASRERPRPDGDDLHGLPADHHEDAAARGEGAPEDK